MSQLHFSSHIAIVNGNPYVTPPETILAAIFQQADKNTGPIPIQGTLNGATFKQTLVKYAGDWRLYINGAMLQAAGIPFKTGEIRTVVGKPVTLTLEFDSTDRTLPMQPQLALALAQDQTAQLAYEALAPYRKQEILRYLGFLKTPASIAKNIARILQHLRGEESDALYPLMHRQRKQSHI